MRSEQIMGLLRDARRTLDVAICEIERLKAERDAARTRARLLQDVARRAAICRQVRQEVTATTEGTANERR